MDVHLAFVVRGPAAEEIAGAHGGFECGGSPKIKRFRRLHVVVAIKEDGGLAGSFERFGIDERMEIRRNDFDLLETGSAKIVGHPASRAFDVRLVFALCAHAGDSQEFAQLCQMLVAIAFYKFSKVHKRSSRGYESFRSNECKALCESLRQRKDYENRRTPWPRYLF